MSSKPVRTGPASRAGTRARGAVTIKDLAARLDLSITTISRALNGYSDVGQKTRQRVHKAAREMGYRPNRNAQRLVTQKTHNIAWVQSDTDNKVVDPHFIEVMVGVLRGARVGGYDIVLSSDTSEHQLGVYDRYVRDQSVDGFIIDLPEHDDPRISFLLATGKPFIVHSTDNRASAYSWVDIDNPGNFRKLTHLLVANGHRRIAFLNGDARYTFATARQQGVEQALRELDLPASTVSTFNATHPMINAGYRLTQQALKDPDITAIMYSSALMAVEGQTALQQAGRDPRTNIHVATMDDILHYLDLSPYQGVFTFVRSSLRQAGEQLVTGLIRQCEHPDARSQTIIPSAFIVADKLDASVLDTL